MAVSRAQETFAHGVTLNDLRKAPLHYTLWRRPTRYWLNLSASLSIPSNFGSISCAGFLPYHTTLCTSGCKTMSITRASLTLPCAGCCLLDFLSPKDVAKPSFGELCQIWVDRALSTEIEQESLHQLGHHRGFLLFRKRAHKLPNVSLDWPGRQSDARRFGLGSGVTHHTLSATLEYVAARDLHRQPLHVPL